MCPARRMPMPTGSAMRPWTDNGAKRNHLRLRKSLRLTQYALMRFARKPSLVCERPPRPGVAVVRALQRPRMFGSSSGASWKSRGSSRAWWGQVFNLPRRTWTSWKRAPTDMTMSDQALDVHVDREDHQASEQRQTEIGGRDANLLGCRLAAQLFVGQ